ncbi:Hsp70 nucleotide exchange factor FES1 [Metschnikowia bicuspidata]|uniref:Hsp70 nucleotide exchange factor FES1 n=1 Tax=Metschnikowia bicuspidata TaxID=27322 RepID=A0A4P9ZE24_9ASCO|nr:Hsp70 nucleotide exchange factor FES1 [Metschnikowia bicuspidata]
MDKLLQWSIAQQSGDKEAMDRIGQPDPKMLQQLFGGPDEPTLMKQAIVILNNDEATDEAKLVALENFELLIENLDNANNIENMNMWPSIIAQLSSSKPDFQLLAASIIGVATQNNPKSQEAFLKHEKGIQLLTRILKDSSSLDGVVLKALFALSSLVRNCDAACKKFVELDGWNLINLSAAESHHLLLRKLSLISALLSVGVDESTKSQISNDYIVVNMSTILVSDGHLGCIEKILNVIGVLKSSGYEFTDKELELLRKGLDNVAEVENLSKNDIKALKNLFT